MASPTTETFRSNIQNEESARESQQRRDRTNLRNIERVLSGLGGSLLLGYGLLRRDWLGASSAVTGAALVLRGATGHSYLYQLLHIDTSEHDTQLATSVSHNQGIKVTRAVTIQKSPEELYSFWRNFENLPRFMQHLQSVTTKDLTHSHWIAKAPAGREVAWDAEIVNDKENELIAWRSVGDADIDNAGSVHFTPAPGGRGTVIKVVLEYDPPVGKAGTFVAKLFGEDPDTQVREDLR
ncbi:MAG TPA: SRPBCC family protein, partial [Ktedonobacteraceae bacterium]|nr:SRPBCC family protein [Ktedonobacteraceae bacterium]